MMDRNVALEELRKLVEEGRTYDVQTDTPKHTKWKSKAEAILHASLDPNSPALQGFSSRIYHLMRNSSSANGVERAAKHFRETTLNAVAFLEAAIYELEMVTESQTPPNSSVSFGGNEEFLEADLDSRVVFVVHGRNMAAKEAMFLFLSSLDLSPTEWDEAVGWTGSGTPYVGEIIEAGLNKAQAILVLMTPDEVSYLDKAYSIGDDDAETRPSPGIRPNVLFEAGMAMGRKPKQTVFVQFGEVRNFSDVHGRHIIRLTNDVEMRRSLALRLQTAGCPVNLERGEWKTAGDFVIPAPPGENPSQGRRIQGTIAQKRINLDAKYHSRQGSGSDRLEIINRGSEDIYNLDLVIPDVPGFLVVRSSLPLAKLPYGKSFQLLTVRTMGRALQQFEITITGRTADGTEVSESAFIDTMGS